MSEYEQVCSTYQCDSCYKTFSTKGSCPKCGISEDEIELCRTNVREEIYKARRVGMPKRNSANTFTPEQTRTFFHNLFGNTIPIK